MELKRKKTIENYDPVDDYGFAIGDIVKFDESFPIRHEERKFKIVGRYSSLKGVYDINTEAYSLIGLDGDPPRKIVNPQSDGFEYFNQNYLIKVKI